MTFNEYMCLVLSAVSFILTIPHAAAYDPLDPNGNITLKWDVISWTSDGYVAVVTMNNFQMYRHIMSPGWTLGWVWAKKEVIWSMVGAQAVDQGDCSKFKGNIPHCCKKNPTVVDLLPGVPYNQQIANCCKAGVVASWGQDPSAAVSSFQLSVGRSGTSNKTVRLPKNFTLLGPGPGYTCSQAKIVRSTVFNSPDGRRKTQALMTWNVICTYSQLLASRYPTCCVSMSSFYNSTITPCPTCAFWWVVCTNALGAFDFHVFLLRAETETKSSRFAGGEFMTIEGEEEEERLALCCQFSNTCKVVFFLKETLRFKVLFGIIGKLRVGPFA